MNIVNLKIELINKINKLTDSYVIEEINRTLDFELNEGIFKLTPEQKERINEGMAEYKAGEVLSEEEANKQIQEWLSK